jgi:hypothetical protein
MLGLRPPLGCGNSSTGGQKGLFNCCNPETGLLFGIFEARDNYGDGFHSCPFFKRLNRNPAKKESALGI